MDFISIGKSKSRSGIAFPVVIAIIVVLFTSIFTIHQLSRGVSSQLEYSDAHVRALAIAESGYQMLLARIMSSPWEQRWFKENADSQTNFVFEKGYFSYYIENTPSEAFSADIWVNGQYKNVKRLLFYRVRYDDLLFKGFSTITPGYTASFEDNSSSGVNPMSDQISKLIEKRKKNLLFARQPWEEKFSEVLSSLDALQIVPPPTHLPVKTQGNLKALDGSSRKRIYEILNGIFAYSTAIRTSESTSIETSTGTSTETSTNTSTETSTSTSTETSTGTSTETSTNTSSETSTGTSTKTSIQSGVITGTFSLRNVLIEWVEQVINQIENLLTRRKVSEANKLFRKLIKALRNISKYYYGFYSSKNYYSTSYFDRFLAEVQNEIEE
ncbi:MAG: hypothetical protein HQM10_08335 [Candidatus Riflebacteria bacterium]|nr:hypothetical protein [Candidatus Riflebacteria bacterium]